MTNLVRLATVILMLSLAVSSRAEDSKPQETCPIGGEPVDTTLFTDVDSVRIYVCSTACIAKVAIDPAGAIETLKQRGERPAQRQTLCPVLEGKAIKKSLYVDHDGKRIYVCCKSCVKKVTQDPATYIAKLEAQGILLERRQVKCPAMPEEDVLASKFVDYEGKRLYLCCDDCIKKVAADPAPYFSKAETNGITLDQAD